jgi:hypothetical protein
VEQLEMIRQQLAADTLSYLQRGGTIHTLPMGLSALDPSTGQTRKAARVFYESSKKGSKAAR